MGRLKELREKRDKKDLNEDEAAELAELEQDVAETPVEEPKEDDEKAIEDLAEKLALATMSKIEEKTPKKEAPKVEVTREARFIVDKDLGRVSVDKLDEVKIELSERKSAGKKFYEVSKKTLHFVTALLQGDREKLQTLVEGTGARGGFLVPEDFVNILIEDRRDMTVMRQLATVLPVSTDTIHIPSLASRPKAFWRSEGAVKSTTTVDFGETVLTPYSLASIVGLSNELVADASLGGSIIQIVSRTMAQSLAEEEDKAFWEGNGSGRPTGIDNYSFTGITAAATDSARADAIIRALYLLPQGYRNNAVAVANRNTWAKVATLKDSQNNYLLSDLASGPSQSLRGRPYYEQNDIPDGRMFIGDFSYYYIADREGVSVDVSTEATVASQSAFERNLTFVRVEERVDGELTLTQPVVEVNGLGGF